MTTTIKKAGKEEIGAIKGIAEIAFRETYREILSPGQIEYMMEMMYSEKSLLEQTGPLGHQFYIALCDGKPAGYVSVNEEGVKDGKRLYHLQKIYVLPEFQKYGIGKSLFKKAEQHIKEAAAPMEARMELNVNRYNKAKAFYEHMGMKESYSGDFPIGNGFYMNDWIMAKDL